MTRAAIVAGAALAFVGPTRADSISVVGPEGGAAVELAHQVDVAIADRTATYRVERELANPGTAVVRAELEIELPSRGVVRSFRVSSGDRWIDGTLLPADRARDAFGELTTSGAQLAHGPALLEQEDEGRAKLSAYPLPPGGRLRVAYTIEAPTCYTAGRWIADYPVAADGMAPLVLRTPGARVETGAQIGAEIGKSLDEACASDVPLAEDLTRRFIVAEAPPAAPAEVRFARAHVESGDLVQAQIDVAPELQPLPRGARVVFVVDASRSMGDAGVADQLAWVAGYLAHVPDASFEIVLYRRWPERVFGRFVSAAHAAATIAAIDPVRLRPGNGSHLDAGLALAAHLLAEPGAAPRRLVAFTDERWRPSWDAGLADDALAALPADAVAHLIDLSPDASEEPPSIARADDDPLAAAAAHWGGIAALAQGGAQAPRSSYAAASLELVRPLRIDHAVLHQGGDATTDLGALAEGAGVYQTWRTGGGPVFVDGMIWGRPWRHEFASGAAPSRRWAGLAVGDPVHTSLTDPELLALATTGGVVSSQTSFLAFDRRWGPARLPDEWIEGDGCGCDLSGISTGGTVGTSGCTGYGVGQGLPKPSTEILSTLLAPRVDACAAQFRQRRWDLGVGFDTTGAEIVDVQVTPHLSMDGMPDDRFVACVADAAWDLALDARFEPFTTHYDADVNGSR
jgi:hypothetical protein